ncbi:fluoride efflux transporter CrcB [Branchiibius sp. NY16-3462-2]|uniref:fluoride efflux transporter CrcB n=1 Tax=Branchiibius sp. NY16-3462-2 TaxID=1807500 RepID=UPI00079743D8|nr:fluoride efflux transporter CrcB [Branchiibius sp. NY16-3462-2]KYH43321.1 chromosome condensation protein CrcB [Branchiibius sp. NY16-3462-2]
MNPAVFAALSVAGGLGAVLRFVIDGFVRARWPSGFPVGTAVINVSGSFILGLLTGLGLRMALGHNWVLVLGTGAMGGYTTFSTASMETVRLAQERRYVLAVVNGLGILAATMFAAWLGLHLGRGG